MHRDVFPLFSLLFSHTAEAEVKNLTNANLHWQERVRPVAPANQLDGKFPGSRCLLMNDVKPPAVCLVMRDVKPRFVA